MPPCPSESLLKPGERTRPASASERPMRPRGPPAVPVTPQPLEKGDSRGGAMRGSQQAVGRQAIRLRNPGPTVTAARPPAPRCWRRTEGPRWCDRALLFQRPAAFWEQTTGWRVSSRRRPRLSARSAVMRRDRGVLSPLGDSVCILCGGGAPALARTAAIPPCSIAEDVLWRRRGHGRGAGVGELIVGDDAQLAQHRQVVGERPALAAACRTPRGRSPRSAVQ